MCTMYLWEHEYIQFNRAAWLFQHAGLDFSAAVPVADLLSPCYRYIYTYKSDHALISYPDLACKQVLD